MFSSDARMTPRACAWMLCALAALAGCTSKKSMGDGGDTTPDDLSLADLSGSMSTDMAGGGGGGGGGTDGFVASDNRLFPLVVGHRWNYTITPKPMGTPTCTVASDYTEVTAQTAFGMIGRFDVKLACFGATSMAQGKTDETFIYLSPGGSGPPKPYTFIGVPGQEGATYTYTSINDEHTWHSLGAYKGYADCWKSQSTQPLAYQIYCRGVGL